jgi:pyruvate dehydrogenase E1 component beta subunit
MNIVGYKDALIEGNTKLGQNKNTRFIGYGLKKGRALGTLKNIDESQIIETPVAENLMVGLAMGLSLKGYRPVVFIERMDFIMNSMDAIVNHLDKMKDISRGEFNPAVILRCVVGNSKKPLYTGITHTQDFSKAIKCLVSFPVILLNTADDVFKAYIKAEKLQKKGISVILIEYKDKI